jgi:drug/metabolite transporter (DMT)-like permease
MGSFIYLIPLVAIGLGWAVLSETPPWLAVVGGAVCLAGVVVARRPSAPALPAEDAPRPAQVRQSAG